MEQAELLEAFKGHLEEYAKLRTFIDRAQEQSGKFSAATIEKVVMKNEIASLEVADQIRPQVTEIEGVLASLQDQIEEVNAKKASADEEMEELQLRQAIGELTDEEFDGEAATFKTELDAAGERLEALESDRTDFGDALARWVELAEKAEHDTGVTPEEPEPEPEIEDEVEVDFESGDEDEDEAPEEEAEVEIEEQDFGGEVEDFGGEVEDFGGEVEDLSAQVDEFDDESLFTEEPENDGVHSSTDSIREDLSGVFGGDQASAAVRVGEEDEEIISIEAGEAGEDVDDGESVDVDFGFEGDDEMDILGGDGADDVEIDLVGDVEDLGLGDDETPAAEGGGEDRRALLIYQEGTAEEQIYPFMGDTLTIGRGRDNDIQIKNDSKVSRYHCKVFRRGDNFYIEDNKSSNGSLVNGELITERRLFGGEEVIIGETFFRFRIME